MRVASQLTLPELQPGRPAPESVLATRQAIEGAINDGVWATQPAPEAVNLGGVDCLQFNAQPNPQAYVLHYHGGAYRVGAPETVAHFAAALSVACNVTVICPRYRLAPENPFPAGLSDAYAVFNALKDRGPGVIVSGDSAGGGLAAAVAALDAVTHPKLIGMMLLSPWLDVRVCATSYHTHSDLDPLFSYAAAREAAEQYLQDHSPDHPLASPLLAPVHHYPPTFINVGDGEVLLDDARDFHAKLLANSARSYLDIVPGMEHVAVTRSMQLPGAKETFDRVVEFVDVILDRKKYERT